MDETYNDNKLYYTYVQTWPIEKIYYELAVERDTFRLKCMRQEKEDRIDQKKTGGDE